MLIYKGEVPQEMAADSQIAALRGSLAFPMKYGYSMVGEVIAVGDSVGSEWLGERVFAFNPHESGFNADIDDLQVIPKDCANEDAAFLANMETAISLVMDGTPLLGENVAVIGQGMVGLLVTALLARFPLQRLVTIDGIPLRRERSMQMGAQESLIPDQAAASLGKEDVDLVYELSGNPEALNLALDLVGDYGRIVVGSWYGNRTTNLNLGGRFHRGRVKIVSSQVSNLDPGLRGRWDKARRFTEAWKWLQAIKLNNLITHRFPISKAGDAYKQILDTPDKTLGVVLTYP
jgi:2-desacetyl-2-hydroxyethyl bacteriochlorophyllide A dehydrogenase